jgi:hypothetical protein
MFDITLLWIEPRQHPGPTTVVLPLWNLRLPRVLPRSRSEQRPGNASSSPRCHGNQATPRSSPIHPITHTSASTGPQRSARERSPTCYGSPPPQDAAAPSAAPPTSTSSSAPTWSTLDPVWCSCAPESRSYRPSTSGCYHQTYAVNTRAETSRGVTGQPIRALIHSYMSACTRSRMVSLRIS